MKIFDTFDIVWEKTSEGTVGFYKSLPKKLFNPTMMKNLAIAKMTNIKLISAYFKEQPVVFSPVLWVLFDSSDSLEFIGVYASECLDNYEDISSDNNELYLLPSVCIRKAFWNKSEDLKQFNSADNKKQYILGENQTISNIYFFNYEQIPLIKK